MRLASLLWIGLVPLAVSAQVSASLPGWKGWTVEFVTKVEPPGSGPARLPGGVVVKDRVHRSITDAQNRRYFGYDLVLNPVDGQSAQLRIEPLSSPGNDGYTLLGPARFPTLPPVHDGETVAFDLLVNPATGQRVVEYLSVRHAGPVGRAPKSARDFGIGDVELRLEQPRAWAKGKPVEGSLDFVGGISAHVLWIYIAREGQFVLSLWQEAGLGFQKAGVVDGKVLTFRAGASEYRVESAGTIAPGSGAYNIYVSRDATCCTFGPGEKFSIGGADKAEYLIRKR